MVSTTCSSRPRQGNSGVAAPSRPATRISIFGRAGGFPAELDLNSLDGMSGYAIHDGVLGDGMGFVGEAPETSTTMESRTWSSAPYWATPTTDRPRAGQSFVFFGGSANLAALDLADGTQDGRISTASIDGSHGFAINGMTSGDSSGRAVGVGDVNGDHIDDLIVGGHGPGAR